MREFVHYHKVKAAKIKAVTQEFAGNRWVNTWRIEIEDSDCPYAEVTDDWVKRHDPQIGGYYVVYSSDCHSYVPSNAFEAEYTDPIQDQTIADYEYRIKALMDEGLRDKARIEEMQVEIEDLEMGILVLTVTRSSLQFHDYCALWEPK